MTLPRRHAPTVRHGRVRTSAIAMVLFAAAVTGCSLWSQGTTDQQTAATSPDGSSARAKELAALTKVLGITDPLQAGIRNNQFDDPPNDIAAAPMTTLAPGAAPTASSSSTTAKEPEGRIPFATRFTLDLARHGAFRHDAGTGRDALFGVGGKLACGARGDLDGSPYAVLCPWAGAPDGPVFWFIAATNMDLPERALDPASAAKPTQRYFQFVALSCPVFTDAPQEPGSIGVTLSGSGPTGEALGTNRYELRLSPDIPSPDESTTTTLVKPPPTTKPKYPCTPHETAARAALIGRTLAIGVPAREVYASTLAWHFVTTGLVAGKAMGDVTDEHNSFVDEAGNKLETTPLTLETTTTTAPRTTTTVDPNASSTTTSINLMPDGTFAPSTTTEPPTTTAPTTSTSAPTTTAAPSSSTSAPP